MGATCATAPGCRRRRGCGVVAVRLGVWGTGTGDEVTMSIAGQVKRRALDEIAARQIAADEKRRQEVGRQQQATVVSPNQWCFSNRLPRTVGASSRAAVRGAKRNHSHLSYQRSMAADSRADRQIRMKAPKY